MGENMNMANKRAPHIACLLLSSALAACRAPSGENAGTSDSAAALHIKQGEQLLYKHQAGPSDDPDGAQAVEEFRTALRLEPGNAVASYRLADALIRSGKYDEALQTLRDLKARNSKP